MNRLSRRPRPSGFTLIELLSVIAIIAVLAILALLSSRRIMDSAGEAKCAGNLRQLVSAWMLYCSENEGKSVTYPVDYPKNDPNKRYNVWISNLLPYLGGGDVDKLLLCPAASKPPVNGDRGGPGNAWRFGVGVPGGRTFLGSYGINGLWYTDIDFMFPDPNMLASVKERLWLKSLNASAASTTLVFSDADWLDFDLGPTPPTAASIEAGTQWQMARHRKKGVNMAFADGHVSFMTIGDAWRSVLFDRGTGTGGVVPRSIDSIPPQYR